MNTQLVDQARRQAEYCKVFGNMNRILIVWALGSEELSVGELADVLESSVQNTSQHLHLMKSKGILESRQEGHRVLYRITPNNLSEDCWVLKHAILNTPLKNDGP